VSRKRMANDDTVRGGLKKNLSCLSVQGVQLSSEERELMYCT